MKSWSKPTDETIDRALASVKKEVDRQYFFSKLKNPLWIDALFERGFFKIPPDAKQLPDGYIQYPFWPELNYLKNVSKEIPDRVVEIILGIQKTENPRIYGIIIDIALELEIEQSVKLLPKVLEHARRKHPFSGNHFDDLLAYWSKSSDHRAALGLARALIAFDADPESNDKQARRKENAHDWSTTLEPHPNFSSWEYQGIMKEGIRPLSEKAPYETAKLLIDVTASMILMKFHPEDLDKCSGEDLSSIWCERVDEPTRTYEDSKAVLVQTLTYACEKVYENDPTKIEVLDNTLRNQRWDLFKRIREHLYAKYLTPITKTWIKNALLDHKDFDQWDYHFEFQRMIRRACEHFKQELLTEEERRRIFESILSGPSLESYKEASGDSFTEDNFKARQRYFHWKQLAPFAPILFGKYAEYFHELDTEESKTITDDDYAPYKSGEVKNGEQRSPKTVEYLAAMEDSELLSYLNEWDGVHRDPVKWWVDINFEALARAFQKVFEGTIIPDSSRLQYWSENRDQIGRPIYVRAMVFAVHQHVKTKQFERLNEWFEFCDWVLSHPENSKKEDVNASDESLENPDWRSARRAVGDFIGECLDIEIDVPIAARATIAGLLEKLCTGFDRRLDDDDPVFLNRDDQLTEAINNTRSRALEDLGDFAIWVRRHDGINGDVEAVFNILELRMKAGPKLTLPEKAILGGQFGRYFSLNADWAIKNKCWFFPKEDFRTWFEAFNVFFRYCRPNIQIFKIIQDDIKFALENISQLKAEKEKRQGLIGMLGEHLFAYYVWDVFPLHGTDSLLDQFYVGTKDDTKRWAQLFNHIGRSLKNAGGHIDDIVKAKIESFFEWRYEKANSEELMEFTFWLEASCLDSEWRLHSYSKILDVVDTHNIYISLQVESLGKLLAQHPPLVVECFAKLTDNSTADDGIYFQPGEANKILRAGLSSSDATIREHAERARENLLRAGRIEFLYIDNTDDS